MVGLTPECVVTDLDRTLTGADLVPDERALARIDELRAKGVRVVIATGRRLEELLELGLVERVDGVVAENGAIVCVPRENVMEVLHSDFAHVAKRALSDLAVRFRWGRVIGSGPRAIASLAGARLRAAGVPHRLEYNAEEVMLLPSGVSKAAGADLCLRRLGLDASRAWAIGDGENDATLLRWARVGAAPANAATAARDAADVLVAAEYSRAFVELTAPLVAPGGGSLATRP